LMVKASANKACSPARSRASTTSMITLLASTYLSSAKKTRALVSLT
jgi:hypothetical protein